MARLVAVVLAVVAVLLAVGCTGGHAAAGAPPSTAEVFWRRAVLPDVVLRRFRTTDDTTSLVNTGMADVMAKGAAGRSTSELDYDDYARLPAATGKAAAPINGMAGGMATSAGRSTSELDYDDYTRLPPGAAGKAAPSNGMAGGVAKVVGPSTSDLDYDDYAHLPPAAGKDPSEGASVRQDDGPFGYDYKAVSDDDVPFNDNYKEPSEPGTGSGATASEARGGAEATSPESKTGKENVGAPYNYGYMTPVERRVDGSLTASESRGDRREKVATTSVFFHEEAVRVGERLHFRFPAAAPAPLGLLPRHAAASVPFATPALATILALFRVPPGSARAAGMAETLRKCEWPPIAGESKFCASSLEDLVDRAAATLGTRDVRAVTSALPRAGAPAQAYVVRAVRRVRGAGFVACHDEAYPYTVYRCHTTGPARAYMMEMEGAAGGASVTVATVCHTDTSRWNPDHLSFKLLGTKPGGAPICHIMPYGHIIWAKNVELTGLEAAF